MTKRVTAMLLAISLCFSLCACKKEETSEAAAPVETPEPIQTVEEPAETKPVLPTATSDDLKLYAFALSTGQKSVVNEYGQYEDLYSFDREGNILDADGTLLVMAENVRNYRSIRTMYFSQDLYTLTAERDTQNAGSELSSSQVYSNCVVELYCAPASATNGVICVRSDSDAVIEIRPNKNARFVTMAESHLENGEIALKSDDLSQPVEIYIRVLTNLAGEATIIARSLDRTAEAKCIVTVEMTDARRQQSTGTSQRLGTGVAVPTPLPTPAIAPILNATEFVNASGNPANHVHSFTKTVTPPTTSDVGYTTHTCTVCGYSYQDDFTSKLSPEEPTLPPHTHDYQAVHVPATETEQGYTLYICSVCGDSYKVS